MLGTAAAARWPAPSAEELSRLTEVLLGENTTYCRFRAEHVEKGWSHGCRAHAFGRPDPPNTLWGPQPRGCVFSQRINRKMPSDPDPQRTAGRLRGP